MTTGMTIFVSFSGWCLFLVSVMILMRRSFSTEVGRTHTKAMAIRHYSANRATGLGIFGFRPDAPRRLGGPSIVANLSAAKLKGRRETDQSTRAVLMVPHAVGARAVKNLTLQLRACLALSLATPGYRHARACDARIAAPRR